MMWLPMLLLLFAAFAAGALPQVAAKAGEAAYRFTDAHLYQVTVLGGTDVSPEPVIEEAPHGARLSSGIAGALLAMVTAAMFLFPALFPNRLLKVVKRIVNIVLWELRRAHSGYIGDYATWLMIGAMIMMAAGMLL